jgi:hypothetical protein
VLQPFRTYGAQAKRARLSEVHKHYLRLLVISFGKLQGNNSTSRLPANLSTNFSIRLGLTVNFLDKKNSQAFRRCLFALLDLTYY